MSNVLKRAEGWLQLRYVEQCPAGPSKLVICGLSMALA